MARRKKDRAPYQTSAGRGTGELVSGARAPVPAAGGEGDGSSPPVPAPRGPGGQPLGYDPGPPSSTLGGALAVTFLCLSPLGALALVYALQVRPRWKRGDHTGARHAADMADRLTFAAVGLQVLLFLAGLVVFGVWWFLNGRNRTY